MTYNFDSLTTNPAIDTAGMTDGAASGAVETPLAWKVREVILRAEEEEEEAAKAGARLR